MESIIVHVVIKAAHLQWPWSIDRTYCTYSRCDSSMTVRLAWGDGQQQRSDPASAACSFTSSENLHIKLFSDFTDFFLNIQKTANSTMFSKEIILLPCTLHSIISKNKTKKVWIKIQWKACWNDHHTAPQELVPVPGHHLHAFCTRGIVRSPRRVKSARHKLSDRWPGKVQDQNGVTPFA